MLAYWYTIIYHIAKYNSPQINTYWPESTGVKLSVVAPNNDPSKHGQMVTAQNPDLPVIDCKLSNWGPWSTCSALCGQGKRIRSRYIIQMPQNGGKPCDKKLTRTQRCKDLPPCPPSSGHNGSGATNNNQHRGNHKHNNSNHHQQHHHHPHGLTLRTTTTTTTTQASSVMDDEDDSKFSNLIRSESGQLHFFAPSWSPTESYYLDGSNHHGSFRIKSGYVYSGSLGNLT